MLMLLDHIYRVEATTSELVIMKRIGRCLEWLLGFVLHFSDAILSL